MALKPKELIVGGIMVYLLWPRHALGKPEIDPNLGPIFTFEDGVSKGFWTQKDKGKSYIQFPSDLGFSRPFGKATPAALKADYLKQTKNGAKYAHPEWPDPIPEGRYNTEFPFGIVEGYKKNYIKKGVGYIKYKAIINGKIYYIVWLNGEPNKSGYSIVPIK